MHSRISKEDQTILFSVLDAARLIDPHLNVIVDLSKRIDDRSLVVVVVLLLVPYPDNSGIFFVRMDSSFVVDGRLRVQFHTPRSRWIRRCVDRCPRGLTVEMSCDRFHLGQHEQSDDESTLNDARTTDMLHCFARTAHVSAQSFILPSAYRTRTSDWIRRRCSYGKSNR